VPRKLSGDEDVDLAVVGASGSDPARCLRAALHWQLDPPLLLAVPVKVSSSNYSEGN
jgi:hypothetical protein